MVTLVQQGKIRKNTAISWSYNEHDHFGYTRLSFMNVMYKYLFDKLGEIDKIWNDSNGEIQVPSEYADLFLERYFPEKHHKLVKSVFGCSSRETVKECKHKFSHFINSIVWVCNTKAAISGPISVSLE